MELDGAVLLPIDMQRAFDGKPWPKRWNADVDGNGTKILSAWRRAKLPLIHVRHDSVVPGSALAPGHNGNQFRDGFEPMPGEAAVSKSVNSAFIGTDLDLRLRRMNVKMIYTFGIATDMCVSTTIRTGSNMGWKIILIEDACDCFDLPGRNGTTLSARSVHEAHVATLGFEFCSVTTTPEMLRALA